MIKIALLIIIFGMFFRSDVLANEKFVTIVNPVRSRELWKNKSLEPIENQYALINKLGMRATWLLQNDMLDDVELINKIKSFDENQELGVFLEVSKKLAYGSRVYYDEQKPWFAPEVVFLSGYEQEDRIKIIDRIMRDFKNTFGYFPRSVGAWWIDSYSQNYLEDKYGIKTILICADQKTTDNYGIWGQWWGYPYFPSRNNILSPGKSKTVVIQWAQRDLEKAYDGEGWQISNYSLQANDYTRMGLDIRYFEVLAKKYLEVEPIGQITVGLETGIESVGNEIEFEKQLNWIKSNKITSLRMADFAEQFGNTFKNTNPNLVKLDDWILTPTYRENKKLGEKREYKNNLVFRDFYEKDTNSFLNRIYDEKNMVKIKIINIKFVFEFLAIIGGFIIVRIWPKIKWWRLVIIGSAVLWLIIKARYTVVNGEMLVGILLDNFRFVGINFNKGLVNSDLSNLVAKSMLGIKINLNLAYYLLFGIIAGILWRKFNNLIEFKKPENA